MQAHQFGADLRQGQGGIAQLEEIALQGVQPLDHEPVELILEDVGLDGVEVLLELGHDGLVVVGHEVQDRIQREARSLGKALRAVLAALQNLRVAR